MKPVCRRLLQKNALTVPHLWIWAAVSLCFPVSQCRLCTQCSVECFGALAACTSRPLCSVECWVFWDLAACTSRPLRSMRTQLSAIFSPLTQSGWRRLLECLWMKKQMPPWSILFANILNAHLPKILTPPSTLGKRTKKIKYDIPIFKRALSLFVDKNPKRKREKQGAKNMYRGLTVYRCIMYSGPCGRRASLLLCLLNFWKKEPRISNMIFQIIIQTSSVSLCWQKSKWKGEKYNV